MAVGQPRYPSPPRIRIRIDAPSSSRLRPGTPGPAGAVPLYGPSRPRTVQWPALFVVPGACLGERLRRRPVEFERMDERFLVTGGLGFMGSAFVRRLAGRG